MSSPLELSISRRVSSHFADKIPIHTVSIARLVLSRFGPRKVLCDGTVSMAGETEPA